MKSPSAAGRRILETADSNGKVRIPEGLDRRSLNSLIRSGHVEYRNEIVRGIPALVPYIKHTASAFKGVTTFRATCKTCPWATTRRTFTAAQRAADQHAST